MNISAKPGIWIQINLFHQKKELGKQLNDARFTSLNDLLFGRVINTVQIALLDDFDDSFIWICFHVPLAARPPLLAHMPQTAKMKGEKENDKGPQPDTLSWFFRPNLQSSIAYFIYLQVPNLNVYSETIDSPS